MLSAEQACDRLKNYENPNYQQDLVRRVLRLGGNLSVIGQCFIRTGPEWNKIAKDQTKSREVYTEAITRFGELKPGDRQKLLKAMFPKLAPQILATWELLEILPYQKMYHRRPFRMPKQFPVSVKISWLTRLLHATRGYDQDVKWFAEWAPYLGYPAPDVLGYLFAGTIEKGGNTGQEVFNLLLAAADGSHEVAAMGRHVVRGLLCASRPEGWDVIERMLLAAQREEGLRQVILESVDEAYPQAFRQMLNLILEHNLTRFSAVTRAVDVWFGLGFEATQQKKVTEVLSRVRHFLNDPAEIEQAIREGSAEDAYYALWSMAFDDAPSALPRAVELYRSSGIERRFAATHLLAQMYLVGSFHALMQVLDDDDMRVAARAAIEFLSFNYPSDLRGGSDLFEHLERFIARLKHNQNTFKPLVWDWMPLQLKREDVAGLLISSLGDRSPIRLIPFLDRMNPSGRSRVASLLKQEHLKDPETRQVMLSLVGDKSSQVRETALKAIAEFKLEDPEIEQMEDLLNRKAQDLRRGSIKLLLNLPDRKLMESIQRLLAQKPAGQRRAGLDLIRECVTAERNKAKYLHLAREFERTADVTQDEARILADILGDSLEQYSLDDALDLMNPDNQTKPKQPPAHVNLLGRGKKIELSSPAAIACLRSLDDLVEQHRTDPIEITRAGVSKTELLGNMRWALPKTDPSKSPDEERKKFPLFEVWEEWWASRPDGLRDPDGQELVRALAISQLFRSSWIAPMQFTGKVDRDFQKFYGIQLDFKLKYEMIVQAILEWLVWFHPAEREADFLLDAVEATVSRIPLNELNAERDSRFSGPKRVIPQERLFYFLTARRLRTLRSDAWRCEHHRRFWQVVRWLDQPKPGLPRFFPELEDVLLAYQCNAATRDDLIDLLLGPRELSRYGWNFRLLGNLTGSRPHPYLSQYPILKEVVTACRERILSIETRRGDLPTAATTPAGALRSIPGQRNLFRVLAAMRTLNFERGYVSGQSRSAVLSKLVHSSYPVESDTHDDFAAQARQLKLSDRRLVELAVYAPQWASYVEFTLKWPELGQAVWWVYAHTKERHWFVDQELQKEWAARISEYTPLSADRLMDGAVDVAWFHRMYAALGEERWKMVDKAAKYASGGSGHSRARLFADTMLSRKTTDEVIERITKKRHQDSVRALGLVPLPDDDDRQAEILRRYEVLQEFLRTGKKYGSQRKASEKLAVAIGMENLARTAGYVDPQRLEWAMEIEAVIDLAEGPVVVEIGETRVSLDINVLGEPELTIFKKDKILKSIPKAIKKDEYIVRLVERKRKLGRQVSRMRQSLEQAMIHGDVFLGTEIAELFRHPMLRAMIEQLIFTGEAGMGYPASGGLNLLTYTGDLITLTPADELRIAHPYDLLESGQWNHWQRDCFDAERIQPFKQVFREVYPLTGAERTAGNHSARYAGQQLNPRQALALFGTRGWVTNPETGVQKTFHNLGISVGVGFLQGIYTPAEVEGLTIEYVAFTQRDQWKPIPLEKIPPYIFSEIMRDLDLVVSVAHAGGVDPEASASSMEAREALVRETCRLLSIKNVQVRDRHVLIEGELGNYTVHLGSAVVHKQPGGAICIVPIHSQHRGRLFLPFVDKDPKSAEVMSKVILLANDQNIRDTTILEQILNR